MYSGRSPTSRSSSLDPVDALLPILDAVDQQWLADDVEQRHARIERRERVLEDHLHLAPQRTQARDAAAIATSTTEPSRLRNRISPARRLDGAQDAARSRRLAAAALADQRQRLALPDVELTSSTARTCADRLPQEAAPNREELLEVLHVQQVWPSLTAPSVPFLPREPLPPRGPVSIDSLIVPPLRHAAVQEARRVLPIANVDQLRLELVARAGHEAGAARVEEAARAAGHTGAGSSR